jgi:hypothetical protein
MVRSYLELDPSMSGYSVPPQAYTRDTLVKAIDWIAHQPDEMRTQATTADALVALYLQSKRRNGCHSHSMSYPVSGENFTEDLKNLAKDLEQFSPTVQSPPNRHASFDPAPQAQRNEPRTNSAQPQHPHQWNVDDRSWAQARNLKERLNLSSESEALRMMIALGAERLDGLIS